MKINPNFAPAWFYKACYQSIRGETDNAIVSLKRAIEIDKKFVKMAGKEKDFEKLRNDERFKELLKK